jgi:hypothetical protein
MASPLERENSIEELLVDLKKGKRRVVSPEEPQIMIGRMLTINCSCKCPGKTKGDKDVQPCGQNMLQHI